MINTKLGNNNFLILIAIILFIVAINLHIKTTKPVFDIEMQDRALNIDKDLLRILAIGNKRTISNILWVQTLMESDASHYNRNDRKNWMYLRFDTISSLDPLFYQNYLWGGMYLSIIKDDMLAASDIFDKGLFYYPDDYSLNFRQGFNHYFELGNFDRGLKYLLRIENHPELPIQVKLIINKLKFETGTYDYDLAIMYLHQQLSQEQDPLFKDKLQADLYALKAEKDLQCLNNNGNNCDRYDAENYPYIFKDNKWTTRKPFLPYRIYRNKKGEP